MLYAVLKLTNENQSKQFNEIEMPCIFLATDKIWNIFLPMFVSCCFPLCIKGTNSIPKYLARVLRQSMDWGCTLSLIKNWFLASRFNKIDRRLISNQVIHHTGVSKNSGIPKWMVKIMENPIKMDDFGVPLFLETPIQDHTGVFFK